MAYRTALAKGKVGITERKKIPFFKAALVQFLRWSEAEHQAHPGTHRRYRVSAMALQNTSGDTSLDRITPEEVERYKTCAQQR